MEIRARHRSTPRQRTITAAWPALSITRGIMLWAAVQASGSTAAAPHVPAAAAQAHAEKAPAQGEKASTRAGKAPAQSEKTPATSATDAAQRFQSLVGDAGCDSDAQCQTVAVGHQACGGPSRFVAWSEKRTDSMAISAAVADLEPADRTTGVDGRFSTCGLVSDPGAYCAKEPMHRGLQGSTLAGVCRLRRSSHGTTASMPDR